MIRWRCVQPKEKPRSTDRQLAGGRPALFGLLVPAWPVDQADAVRRLALDREIIGIQRRLRRSAATDALPQLCIRGMCLTGCPGAGRPVLGTGASTMMQAARGLRERPFV